MRLAFKPYQGLEVVVPKRFPKRQIPGILQQHESWIMQQLEKHRDSLVDSGLPGRIALNFLDLRFDIEYQHSERIGLTENGNLLIIRHQTSAQAIQLLRDWIRAKAKICLPEALASLAQRFGFSYKRASIRSQKSRWGSCSSSGTISLNDQLLFMPKATVHYLMIHELCHTRQMNHSAAFWQQVESCCTDFREHDAALSRARATIPGWFSRSLFASF